LKRIFFIGLLFVAFQLTAQETQLPPAQAAKDSVAPQPPYLKSPYLPSFKIWQLDSIPFTKDSLQKSKYTAIVYFSPTCGHCRSLMERILPLQEKLQHTEFVWATVLGFPEIKKFVSDYALDKYSNIHVGQDPIRFFSAFFAVRFVPIMAIYDKKGRFVTTLNDKSTEKEILDAMK
jgi:thiol-disulfide isomerase/thioredoxin